METSVFLRKTCRNFRGVFGGKDRFVIKIPVLTPKTRFSILENGIVVSGYIFTKKKYFATVILNLSLLYRNLAEIPGFFRWKRPLSKEKLPVLAPKRGFLEEKSTLHLNSILQCKPQFDRYL